MKIYRKSPLPFLGQKYRRLNQLDDSIAKLQKGSTVVDLFGGSGLISHYIKRKRPDLTVVYNDFDDFKRRLENIDETNRHLSNIKTLVTSDKNSRLTPPEKQAILSYLERQESKGFIDLITIASSIQFGGKNSGTIEQLRKNSMYNNMRKNPYFVCETYLAGLQIVRKDAFSLLDKYKGDAFFIVDPPYLATISTPYRQTFGETQHVKLLKALERQRFIYFAGCPDALAQLTRKYNLTTLNDARAVTADVTLNYHARVKDSIYFRGWSEV